MRDSIPKGLSSKEAEKRLAKYGKNEVKEQEKSFFSKIWEKLWNPTSWMIELVALLSLILSRFEDFFIALAILIVNITLQIYQEHKASSVINEIKRKIKNTSLVIRDGKIVEIDNSLIVKGDVIKLKAGDVVPADVKLLTSFLEIDDSSISGESLLRIKKSGELVYAKSIVKRGEAFALVLKTGKETYFGKTLYKAQHLKQKHNHIEENVILISNYLIIFSFIISFLIFLDWISSGKPLFEGLRFSIALFISSIPIALPAFLTIMLALGAYKLAKNKAIIKRLSSLEDLAGVDILCLDKTGTLTKNELRVLDPISFSSYKKEDLILLAALCSREENNDPIEKPIFSYLEEKNLRKKLLEYKQLKFIPFDPIKKRTEALIQKGKKKFWVVKGAPQVIINLCKEDGKAIKKVEELSKKGFRVIALAIKDKKYSLIGLIPLYDEIRPDSYSAIEKIKSLGVKIKLITGDNIYAARYVMDKLKIKGRLLKAKEIREDEVHKELELLANLLSRHLYERLKPKASKKEVEKFSKEVVEELSNKIHSYHFHRGFVKKHESEIIEIISKSSFAEVFPQDKYFIVKELQKSLHSVAMSGDGVNDILALKKADVGISLGSSPSNREVSDLIILRKGISPISDAIEIARRTFEKMKAYVSYRVTESIRILIFIATLILIFDFNPLTPIMLLFLTLLNDIPILSIAYDNTKPSKHPSKWKPKNILKLSFLLGFLGFLSSLILFFILKYELSIQSSLIQSILFTKLVVSGHATIFHTRSEKGVSENLPSLTLVVAVLLSSLFGTYIAIAGSINGFYIMKPIGISWALFVWAYSILWFIISDVVKIIYVRKTKEKFST